MVDRARSQITVDAEPSAVMAVIADFPAYPEWVSSLKACEVVEDGPDGRASQVRFNLDAGVLKDEYVLAYDWSGDDEVSWHLVKSSAMKSQYGTYTLTAVGDGRTEVIYDLAVDLKLPMLGMFKRKAEKMIMETALKDLKKRVESL